MKDDGVADTLWGITPALPGQGTMNLSLQGEDPSAYCVLILMPLLWLLVLDAAEAKPVSATVLGIGVGGQL
jgi:hypothetical protein